MPIAKQQYLAAATDTRRLNNYRKWVTTAVARHSEAFSYADAKSGYVTQKHPRVTIFCNVHQRRFDVTPHDHLRYVGGGCPECEGQARSCGKFEAEKAKFLEWFQVHRAHRFELASPFLGMTKQLSVRCHEHEQTEITRPTYLMAGKTWGCRRCSSKKRGAASRLPSDELRRELVPLMPVGVSIEEVYFDEGCGATRIRIACEKHGITITDAAYLRKSPYKCPHCGNAIVGYAESRIKTLLDTSSEGRDTWLGVMEVEVFGISTLKVGISCRGLKQRYRWDLKRIFYSVRLKEIDALVLENRVHRAFRAHQDDRIRKAGMRSGRRWSGDTECYWFNQREGIIAYIIELVDGLKLGREDYRREIEHFERAWPQGENAVREKDLTNRPRPVVCIDTHEHFPSIAEAARSCGINHGNLSMVISGRRRLAGGFRWAYAEDFESVKHVPLRDRAASTKAVRCIETQEIFPSISQAARATGTSGSHITAVCNGTRTKAGGRTWEYIRAESS